MPVIDTDCFAKHLRDNAQPHSVGKCARYVRQALQAAGGVLPGGNPYHAKEYGKTLLLMGFREIRVDRASAALFLKGDIIVLQPYPNGNISGHIAGFDGTYWISDFRQLDCWGGTQYRLRQVNYAFYRP